MGWTADKRKWPMRLAHFLLGFCPEPTIAPSFVIFFSFLSLCGYIYLYSCVSAVCIVHNARIPSLEKKLEKNAKKLAQTMDRDKEVF
jgi:hypothetical protein